MQFITDNYIWFLIGGIVLLMVIIGYIAEKTDFGHKDVGKKEKKSKKKEKELKKLEEANLKLNDVVYNDNNVEVIEDLSTPLNKEEDLTVPLNGDKVVEEVLTPLSKEEDLTVPLNGDKVVEEVSTPLNKEEDLTVPLNGLPSEPESVEIEETLKENDEVKATDDVWKF